MSNFMVWFSSIITNYYYYLLQLLVSDPSYTVKSLKANFLTNCRYSKTNYYNLLAYLKVNKQSWNLVGCLGNPSVLVCCFLSSYKLQGQVPSCELVIFALKSSGKDQTLVPVTSPTNSNQFEFSGQVLATCFSKRFDWKQFFG